MKVGGIGPDASKTFKLTVRFPAGVPTDDYRLRVDIDTSDMIDEGGSDGETNNAALTGALIAVTEGFYDIVPTIENETITGTISVGDAIRRATAEVRLSNAGNLKLPKKQKARVTVSLRPAVGDDILLGSATESIGKLVPGGSRLVKVSAPVPGTLALGDYTLVIDVTPVKPLNESDSDNQTLGGLLSVV